MRNDWSPPFSQHLPCERNLFFFFSQASLVAERRAESGQVQKAGKCQDRTNAARANSVRLAIPP